MKTLRVEMRHCASKQKEIACSNGVPGIETSSVLYMVVCKMHHWAASIDNEWYYI